MCVIKPLCVSVQHDTKLWSNCLLNSNFQSTPIKVGIRVLLEFLPDLLQVLKKRKKENRHKK